MANLNNIFSKISSFLDVTTKELNQINRNIRVDSELMTLSRKVSCNELSYSNAINYIEKNLGKEYLSKFEVKLESYKNNDYKRAIMSAYPISKEIPREINDVRNEIIKKYGSIDEMKFQLYEREWRQRMYNCLNKESIRNLDSLNNIELVNLYHKSVSETNDILSKLMKEFK